MNFQIPIMVFYQINSFAIRYQKQWKKKLNSFLIRVRIVCGTIYYSLLSPDSRKRLKTIYFLELMAKDAPLDFHVELFTKSFCKHILRILEKRRKKYFTFFNRYITSNLERQTEIENRLLFLIQIWYDTFMVRYDVFKNIIELYKTLREEGVIFPLRDVSQKHFIKNHVEQSPIYETFTENFVYEEPKKLMFQKQYKVENFDLLQQNKNTETHCETTQNQTNSIDQEKVINSIKNYQEMKANNFSNIQGYLKRKNVNIID